MAAAPRKRLLQRLPRRPVVNISAALVLLCAMTAFAQSGGEAEVAIPADAAANAGDGARDEADTAIPTKSLWDMMVAGGPVMIPIAISSFILSIFTFERLLSLRRARVLPKPFVRRFLAQLRENQYERKDALELCEENGSPVARVFAAGVRKWGKPAVEVEQAILDEGERAANSLRSYLRVINGVATIGPLLGLLGTVWGMMQAFNEIAANDAMGRAAMLAGGISEALVTTAAGLLVAIPAITIYLYFVGRVDALVMELDALGQEVVACISAEGLADADRQAKAVRPKKAA